MKKIKLAWINQYPGYRRSLPVRLLTQMLGDKIEFTQPGESDLLFIGPFHRRKKSRFRKWQRKYLSSKGPFCEQILERRDYKPLTVYHTGENTRHNSIATDYSISFDLSVQSEKHLRMPNWHNLLDWSSEGLENFESGRFGPQISQEKFLRPLDKAFFKKPRKAALVCMHLTEPRRSLMAAVQKVMPVDGYGGAFSKEITNHSRSVFTKSELLKGYGFSLCPENSLYPGYYTEKIPEAFACAALPISWCDHNVTYDFNPGAFINMHQYAAEGYETVIHNLLSPEKLQSYANTPLLARAVSLDPLREFLERIVSEID